MRMTFVKKSSSRKAGSANLTAKGGAGISVSPGKGGHRNNSVTHCVAKGKANKTSYGSY